MLDLGAEVDARGDLEGDRLCVEVEVLELRVRRLHDTVVSGQALLDLLVGGLLAVVVDVHHLGCLVRAPLGQLDEAESFAPLDDDVQPAVVEALEHLDNACARADLTETVVIREDEPELLVVGEALADQLLVARLEDVQGRLLPREEDEVQREQAELTHC